MVYNHRAAYELTEIRVGGAQGHLPLHHTGRAPEGTIEALEKEVTRILTLAYGPDGDEKRANMNRLKEKFEKAWTEGGSVRRNLDSFLADVCA